MATRQEIIDKLAWRRVKAHYLPNLSRQMTRQAASSLTDTQWDELIRAIRDANAALVGEIIHTHIINEILSRSVQDVEGRLAVDDKISVNELIDLL